MGKAVQSETRACSFKIKNKIVTVSITYGQTGYEAKDVRSYRVQDFNQDTKMFIEHHSSHPVSVREKETFFNSETEKYEPDYPKFKSVRKVLKSVRKVLSKLQKPSLPLWSDFIKDSSNLLFRTINQALLDFPDIVTSENFHLHLHIIRPPAKEFRDWYGDYKQDISNTHEVYVYFSGLWVVERIFAPWYFSKRYDYPNVYKYFVHELGQHHLENVSGAFKFEKSVEDRLEALGEKLANPAVSVLYSTLFELMSEGGGEFFDKQCAEFVVFRKNQIDMFKRNMEVLSAIGNVEEAKAFWYSKLSCANIWGNYYIGRLMFFTIGLSLLPKKSRIIVNGVETLPGKLNSMMNNENVKIANYSSEHIKFTKEYVDSFTKRKFYRIFIQLYENACKTLGIAKNYRVITWADFDCWKKQMTEHYATLQNSAANKKGFSSP